MTSGVVRLLHAAFPGIPPPIEGPPSYTPWKRLPEVLSTLRKLDGHIHCVCTGYARPLVRGIAWSGQWYDRHGSYLREASGRRTRETRGIILLWV